VGVGHIAAAKKNKKRATRPAKNYYYTLYPKKFKDSPHVFRKRFVKLQKKHTIYAKHDSFKNDNPYYTM